MKNENEEVKQENKIEQPVIEQEEDVWTDLGELIRYYIFENTLDPKFYEVAQQHYQLKSK